MALPLAASLLRVALVAGLGWLGVARFGPTGLYATLVLGLMVYAATNAFGVMRWSRLAARPQPVPGREGPLPVAAE
jgi:hypothetical protein